MTLTINALKLMLAVLTRIPPCSGYCAAILAWSGCGIAQCGSCAVWLNGAPARSCQLPWAHWTTSPSLPMRVWQQMVCMQRNERGWIRGCGSVWILPGRTDHGCGSTRIQTLLTSKSTLRWRAISIVVGPIRTHQESNKKLGTNTFQDLTGLVLPGTMA